MVLKAFSLITLLFLITVLVKGQHVEPQEVLGQNSFVDGPVFPDAEAIKEPTWLEKYGPQIDQPFSGPLSFSHLPYYRCLEKEDVPFDIAIIGMPLDTTVSYRTGCAYDLMQIHD
jgi:agmatinase